jgi:hypothetical protein
MLRNIFDENGPGLVGVVASYIMVMIFLAVVFYLFGL